MYRHIYEPPSSGSGTNAETNYPAYQPWYQLIGYARPTREEDCDNTTHPDNNGQLFVHARQGSTCQGGVLACPGLPANVNPSRPLSPTDTSQGRIQDFATGGGGALATGGGGGRPTALSENCKFWSQLGDLSPQSAPPPLDPPLYLITHHVKFRSSEE